MYYLFFATFLLLRTADALVSTGLAALGYKYVNIGMPSSYYLPLVLVRISDFFPEY